MSISDTTTLNTAPILDLGQYTFQISPQGLANLSKVTDPADPARNIVWTIDPKIEIPIIMTKDGVGAIPPITVMELWKNLLPTLGKKPALSEKINGKWQTISYNEYYDLAVKFALGLIRLGISERSAVSILGYNCSNWFIDFFGAIFANCVACGHYLTNAPDAVAFVIQHSDSEVFIAENQEQLDKVLQIWDQVPNLKYVLVWQAYKVPEKYQKYASRIMSHSEFLQFEVTETLMNELEKRMKVQKPGNAISYVYTSGTTGNPKGVMLSHDNYVWTALSGEDGHIRKAKAEGVEFRIVSYLPLSHVAAQYCDLFLSICNGCSVFFTDVNALRGTLVDYLVEVRPVIFLGVPRIYEKMEEKVKAALEKKPFVYKWATHYGQIGMDAVMKGRDPPIMYKVFDKLVYSKVKQNLGLDQCIRFFSGAAPLPLKTRQFFFNLGIFLNNTFGMSETTAPMTTLFSESYHLYDLSSAGLAIPGSEVSVLRSDPKSQHGELCFRGRNIFMGYLKNEQATRECLDNSRRVHSGDEGFVTKEGVMHITGRLKEILVTAGGENVAPVIIEMCVKEELPFISNIMALGDHRKYIAAMISLKVSSQASESPNRILLPEAIEYLESQGIKGLKTVDEAVHNPEVRELVQAGIDRANKKAVSNAAKIKAWFFILDDFSIPGGELTPTLKVRRSQVTKKYAQKIDELYSRQDL